MTYRLLALPCALAACHHGSGPLEPTGMPAPAMEAPPPPYPAFLPDAPQIQDLGGPVLTTPKVVAITFAGDALVDDIEQFVTTVGATPYWHDVTAEYGIGPLVALPPVRLTDAPPARLGDMDIQSWLADKLDGTHPEFPTDAKDVIFAIFYPATTVISDPGGNSCQSFGGYHSQALLKDYTSYAVYAVLPRCSAKSASTLDLLTSSLSHELIEAAEDPLPLADPAYGQVDEAHFAWTRLLGGVEAGDLCAQNSDADFVPDGFRYRVQRSWSNAAARAGHDPCVPADPAPYFNAVPTSPIDLLSLSSVDTQGWTIPVGESRTIELALFSDGPTDGPWQVEVVDLSAFRSQKTPALKFELDKREGKNGDKLQLTVTTLSASTSRLGAATFMIRSNLGGLGNYWLGLIKTSSQ